LRNQAQGLKRAKMSFWRLTKRLFVALANTLVWIGVPRVAVVFLMRPLAKILDRARHLLHNARYYAAKCIVSWVDCPSYFRSAGAPTV